jgi:hypothetical protein
MLPENTLIEIFCFYANDRGAWRGEWHTLAHVCQRWRSIVFGSPRHLRLELIFTGKRPITEMLDVWPRLPVVIWVTQDIWDSDDGTSRVDNILPLLDSEHRDRICEITLVIRPSFWERIAPAMQRPFPELKRLYVRARASPDNDGADRALVLSNLPLIGSASHLRILGFHSIQVPFPVVQLLSSNNLVGLFLLKIPHSGYFSPDAMVTCLAAFSCPGSNNLGLDSNPLYLAQTQ